MEDDRTPLVSVVVATNSRGPFLEEALASLQAQTYPHVDSVVVDDGSEAPGALDALVRRFPRVRLVRQEPAGVAVARNNGVSRSRGELIAFLDDDDRWHAERIQRQVAAMVAEPDAVVSYCGLRTVDDAGVELVPADQSQVRDIHDVLRRRTGILAPNLMIRRETFGRIGGFHPAFRLAQDLDLVLKAALEGPFLFVEGALVDYRYHPDNNTGRHRELCRSIDHVLRLHRWAAKERGRQDLVADLDFSLAANGRFALWSVARAARRLREQGQYLDAAREVAWAISFAPTAPASSVRRRLPTRSGWRRLLVTPRGRRR